MPTTPTINGQTALWGMDGSVYTGIITSFSRSDKSDEAEILDNNGYRIGDITFNQMSEFSIELLLQTGTTIPTVGDLITLGGVADCIVKSIDQNYVQKDWRKLKFTAKNFVNLT